MILSLIKSLAFTVSLQLNRSATTVPTVDNGGDVYLSRPSIEPLGENVNGDLILTDSALALLDGLGFTNVSLFNFAGDNQPQNKLASGQCKTAPSDPFWPDESLWNTFNSLTGGAVIRSFPIASVCYQSWGNFDTSKCALVIEHWANISLRISSPSELMFPRWEGITCIPPGIPTNGPTGTCTLGGYPSYVVNATNVAQIQLAVNFARNLNIRLVIKNTGHDFNGRSTGAGALSIWMHSWKEVQFYENYSSPSYSGPAMKVGAGLETKEFYAAAEKYGVTGVGGQCTSVAVGGGFMAGGGHGPMTPSVGLGADQVLSIDVVTPDGRFVTANETHNTELFWALRGGGGSTFGVTTSWTVKVAPRLTSASVLKFDLIPNNGVTNDVIWEAFRIYMSHIPTYNAAGNYEYFMIAPVADQVVFSMKGWFAPNISVAQHQNLVKPLFQEWAKLGIKVDAEWQHFDDYLSAWRALTDAEIVGWTTSRSGSRLVPRGNLLDPNKLNHTHRVIRDLFSRGSVTIVGYGISASPSGVAQDNAVNPAWRSAAMHVIGAFSWNDTLSLSEVSDLSLNFTNEWLKPLRDITEGAYASEADILEPAWQQSFYGSKYERLYRFKQLIDSTGLFYAHKAVGSEDWRITGQLEGLPTQNGRLCRVQDR